VKLTTRLNFNNHPKRESPTIERTAKIHSCYPIKSNCGSDTTCRWIWKASGATTG